jgi:hypothetical protein
MAGALVTGKDSDNAILPRPTILELMPLARLDFWCFVELVFPFLHPNQPLVHAQYLELIATLLMRVEAGKYRRVIFNLPPRHMKSMLVSVLYPAWRLGRNPSAKFICISYGDDLAHDHSAATRKVMLSPLYRKMFPQTVLDKKSADYVRTTKGGFRYATAVGSDITGFGADEIIIDDPLQPDEATSERAKERVRTWVQSSVLTRFNNPSRGALMLVMHRIAPDDLSATMEASGDDFVLRLPLIAEKPEHFTREGKTLMERQPGEVLNPGRLSAAGADELKATLPRHVFASQYQQRPTAGGSGMLSIERFRRYDFQHPPEFELSIHSWDIGATISGNASVCTKWGLIHEPDFGDVLYLTDVLRLRRELPEVRAAVKAEDRRDRPALIVLDQRGVGMGLYQELCREGYQHINYCTATSEPLDRDGNLGSRPNLSKVEQFGRAVLAIDDERVVIPDDAPWLEAFLYEVASFPNIAEDDQVDSMCQLVAYLDRAMWLARFNAQCRE